MSLNIPIAVLACSQHPGLARGRALPPLILESDAYHVPTLEVSGDLLEDLASAAGRAGDTGYGRVIAAIQAARAGVSRPVPHQYAAPEMLLAFLALHSVRGWACVDTALGHPQPARVRDIRQRPAGRIRVDLDAILPATGSGLAQDWAAGVLTVETDGHETRSGTPQDILHRLGLREHTPALDHRYHTHLRAATDLIRLGPGIACTATGVQLHRRRRDPITAVTASGRTLILPQTPDSTPTTEQHHPDSAGTAAEPAPPLMAVLEAFDPVLHTAVLIHPADLHAP